MHQLLETAASIAIVIIILSVITSETVTTALCYCPTQVSTF